MWPWQVYVTLTGFMWPWQVFLWPWQILCDPDRFYVTLTDFIWLWNILYDPDRCMLTPERSIQIQRSIGADIMMQVLHRESIFNACHERPTYICSWMMLLTLDMRTKTDLKKQDTGLWGGWTGEHSLWVFDNGVGCWSEPALFHKVSLCPPSTWPPKPVSHSAGRAGGG